jgi:hypothetical protein
MLARAINRLLHPHTYDSPSACRLAWLWRTHLPMLTLRLLACLRGCAAQEKLQQAREAEQAREALLHAQSGATLLPARRLRLVAAPRGVCYVFVYDFVVA